MNARQKQDKRLKEFIFRVSPDMPKIQVHEMVLDSGIKEDFSKRHPSSESKDAFDVQAYRKKLKGPHL